jgi:hypothetical protein
MPYKGEGGHPDLWGVGDGKRAFFWIKQGKPDPAAIHWGFVAENENKVDEFYKAAMSAGAGTTFRPAHDWNTIRDTTPLIVVGGLLNKQAACVPRRAHSVSIRRLEIPLRFTGWALSVQQLAAYLQPPPVHARLRV